DVIALKDVVVVVDELSRLAVTPREDADAATDVRLNRRVAGEWQESNEGGERDDSQLLGLRNVRAVAVDLVRVNAPDALGADAEAEAAVEVADERELPLAADRR